MHIYNVSTIVITYYTHIHVHVYVQRYKNDNVNNKLAFLTLNTNNGTCVQHVPFFSHKAAVFSNWIEWSGVRKLRNGFLQCPS